jgi:hypothetical protein
MPKTPRKEKEAERRKLMSEVLLRKALELDIPWIEEREEDGEVIKVSLAPEELPAFVEDNFKQDAWKDANSKTERGRSSFVDDHMTTVEKNIQRLVELGCSRRVIYFGLEAMSPHEAAKREGRRRLLEEVGPDGECEQLDEYGERPGRTTRDDMGKLKAQADYLRRLVSRHRRGILLAAEAQRRYLPISETTGLFTAPKDAEEARAQRRYLPSGEFTTPTDAEDTVKLLINSLTWLSDLDEEYAGVMEAGLLKGKELLRLTAYVVKVRELNSIVGPEKVEMHSALTNLVNLIVKAMPEPKFKVKEPTSRVKVDEPPPETVEGPPPATVEGSPPATVEGSPREPDPSDLLRKLDDFLEDYPNLHRDLMNKLEKLHRFHMEP